MKMMLSISNRSKRCRPARVLSLLACCRSVRGLHVAVITGNSRTSGPPRPILGPRVTSYIQGELAQRGHEVSVIDPLQWKLPLLEKPHFCYAKGRAPPELEEIYGILDDADAYVCITPEYNHAPSPALLNVLNHFGSSTFSFKPSAIVSYSAGQWGGTRAALALRPVLSELGCLPVSAMIHIPKAQEILEEGGTLAKPDDAEEWSGYCGRTISQLEWWGQAAKSHKETSDPFDASPSFQKTASQRNAPK